MALSVFANIARWAGGLLSPASQQSSAAPTIPDVRVTNRKYSWDLLNAPILQNTTWYSPWFDTNISGAQYVQVTYTTDNIGSSGTMILYQTDIIEDANLAWNGNYFYASGSGTSNTGNQVVNGAATYMVRG